MRSSLFSIDKFIAFFIGIAFVFCFSYAVSTSVEPRERIDSVSRIVTECTADTCIVKEETVPIQALWKAYDLWKSGQLVTRETKLRTSPCYQSQGSVVHAIGWSGIRSAREDSSGSKIVMVGMKFR